MSENGKKIFEKNFKFVDGTRDRTCSGCKFNIPKGEKRITYCEEGLSYRQVWHISCFIKMMEREKEQYAKKAEKCKVISERRGEMVEFLKVD